MPDMESEVSQMKSEQPTRRGHMTRISRLVLLLLSMVALSGLAAGCIVDNEDDGANGDDDTNVNVEDDDGGDTDIDVFPDDGGNGGDNTQP